VGTKNEDAQGNSPYAQRGKGTFPETFQEIQRLSPGDRVLKFEAICKWLGVKPTQIIGHIVRKHKPEKDKP
jgi:hypothetical protein